jgi:hypothetical protein
LPQRPFIAIFALTGPITHNRKAANDPKKPIIALNSGTRIETPTAATVRSVRSMAIPAFLNAWFWNLEVLMVLEVAVSGEAGGGVLSSPRRASRVPFSGREVRPNFDL